MLILERAREIIINPRVTWQVIKEEKTDVKQLFVNYVAPLALIPAVSALVGSALVGIRLPSGIVRAPFIEAFMGGAVGYVMHLVGIYFGAWLVRLLAPFFGSKVDPVSSLKVVVYSMTPVWLVGIFSILPGLGILSILGLYSVYLLALGLPLVLETPSNKVALYTVSIVVVGMLVNLILSMLVFGMIYGPMYMRMMAV